MSGLASTPRGVRTKRSACSALCSNALIWLVGFAALACMVVMARSAKFVRTSPLREQALLAEVAALRAELRLLRSEAVDVEDAVRVGEEDADLWGYLRINTMTSSSTGSEVEEGAVESASDILSDARLTTEEHLRGVADELLQLHTSFLDGEDLGGMDTEESQVSVAASFDSTNAKSDSTATIPTLVLSALPASRLLHTLPLPEAVLARELQWRFGTSLSADDAALIIARHLLLPSRHWANPVRRAWIGNRLDWHNLVKGGSGHRSSSSSRGGRGKSVDDAVVPGLKDARKPVETTPVESPALGRASGSVSSDRAAPEQTAVQAVSAAISRTLSRSSSGSRSSSSADHAVGEDAARVNDPRPAAAAAAEDDAAMPAVRDESRHDGSSTTAAAAVPAAADTSSGGVKPSSNAISREKAAAVVAAPPPSRHTRPMLSASAAARAGGKSVPTRASFMKDGAAALPLAAGVAPAVSTRSAQSRLQQQQNQHLPLPSKAAVAIVPSKPLHSEAIAAGAASPTTAPSRKLITTVLPSIPPIAALSLRRKGGKPSVLATAAPAAASAAATRAHGDAAHVRADLDSPAAAAAAAAAGLVSSARAMGGGDGVDSLIESVAADDAQTTIRSVNGGVHGRKLLGLQPRSVEGETAADVVEGGSRPAVEHRQVSGGDDAIVATRPAQRGAIVAAAAVAPVLKNTAVKAQPPESAASAAAVKKPLPVRGLVPDGGAAVAARPDSGAATTTAAGAGVAARPPPAFQKPHENTENNAGSSSSDKHAEEALYRMKREAYKDALIALLQGYTRLRASHAELITRATDPAFGGGGNSGLLDDTLERLLDTGYEVEAAGREGDARDWSESGRLGGRAPTPAPSSSASSSYEGYVGYTPPSPIGAITESLRWSMSAAASFNFGSTLTTDDLIPQRASESDWGPLAKFAACGVVRDPCMIHASLRACLEDELCGWCNAGREAASTSATSSSLVKQHAAAATAAAASTTTPVGAAGAATGVCLDRFTSTWPESIAGTPERVCAAPLLVNRVSVPAHYFSQLHKTEDASGGGKSHRQRVQVQLLRTSGQLVDLPPGVDPLTTCVAIVTRRRPAFFALLGDNKMGYHFFTGGAGAWMHAAGRGGGLHHLRQHVWVDPSSSPEFGHFLFTFSDACPRKYDAIPEGLCYAVSESGAAPRSAVVLTRENERSNNAAPASAPAAEVAADGVPAWAQQLERVLSGEALTGLPDPVAVPLPSSVISHPASSSTETEEDEQQELVPLEPVLQSVRRGMRLGLKGMAAALRAVADTMTVTVTTSAQQQLRERSTAAADDVEQQAALPRLPLLRALSTAMTPAQLAGLPGALSRLALKMDDPSGEDVLDLPRYVVHVLGLWGVQPPGLAEAAAAASAAAAAPAARGANNRSVGSRSARQLLALRDASNGAGTAVAADAPAEDTVEEPDSAAPPAAAATAGEHEEDAEEEEAAEEDEGAASEIIDSASGEVTRPRQRPLITLVSRRNKRFIMNEPALVRALQAVTGAQVIIATLETMPLYEQIRLYRRTDLLIGVHGSALINSIFMRPGSALLQIMPYRVAGGSTFFASPAAGAGVAYHELTHTLRQDAVHHFHFVDRGHARDVAHDRAAFLSRGSGCCGPVMYFSFWINSDFVVDAAAVAARAQSILSKYV